MALQPPPKLIGKLTITTGSNDRVDWTETNGVTPVNKNTTLAPGNFYPSAILDALVTAMTAASSYGASYTYSISNTTGIITISASGGTLTGWYPKIKTTESSKLLTGGNVAAETQGRYHLGWYVDSAYPSYALSFSSDTAPAFQWYPSQPCQSDDSRTQAVMSELVSLSGKQYVYNYSGSTAIPTIDYRHNREIGFLYLTDTDRANWLSMWLAYAQHGETFRWYPDRTDVAYEEMALTGDSLHTHSPDRVSGYPLFAQRIQMRRLAP